MNLHKAIRMRQKASKRQEQSIARDVAGRRVAGSGSMPSNKGDVKAGAFLIEAKQTKGLRFSLTLALWRKIYSEAAKVGKRPAMVIEMAGRKVAVLDYDDFLAFQEH